MRITDELLGGWNNDLGLVALFDDGDPATPPEPWPPGADIDQPSTWAVSEPGPHPPQELIINGGFENTQGTFVRDSYGSMSLPSGSVAIPGWTTTSAELTWVDNTNSFGVATPFGRYSLDLTGYHDAVPYAGITQTIPTVPGKKYRLSLSLGSNADFPNAGGQKSVSVCAGSSGTTFTLQPTNATGNQWETFSFHFTAENSFTEIGIGGILASGVYLGVDNVSVVAENEMIPPIAEELVINGSFENTCGFLPDGNRVMSLPVGSTAIPGWTTTTAELLWGLNGNPFGPRTPYGSLFVDLTGYHDSEPYAGITQTLATTSNQTYRLTFALGADGNVETYRGPMSVSVTAGAASNSFTFTATEPGNSWGVFTMEFVAESASTLLAFIGTASAGGAYLGIDNVSVMAHDPTLKMEGLEAMENSIRFRFPTVAGRTYSIESCENLEAGTWEIVPGTETTGTGSSVQITIPRLSSQPRQFYRVKAMP